MAFNQKRDLCPYSFRQNWLSYPSDFKKLNLLQSFDGLNMIVAGDRTSIPTQPWVLASNYRENTPF